MAPSTSYEYEMYNVTFPSEFVAHVEINRPEKMNAFKESMWLNLEKIFDRLSKDPDVRSVVLSGKGDRAFTAGLDVCMVIMDIRQHLANSGTGTSSKSGGFRGR